MAGKSIKAALGGLAAATLVGLAAPAPAQVVTNPTALTQFGNDLLDDGIFLRGHYVVRSYDHFGRLVFVEVDPYTGAFIGEFRA